MFGAAGMPKGVPSDANQRPELQNFSSGPINMGNISNIARDQDASYLHINNTNISI